MILKQVLRATPLVLRRLSERLGRVPSTSYICLYLGIILTFSGIYYLLPDRSFYHTTSQYEYENLNKDAGRVFSALQTSIKTNITRYYKLSQPILNVNGWKIDVGNLSVESLHVDKFPDQVSFHVSVPIAFTDRDRGEIRTSLRTDVIVPAGGIMLLYEGLVYLGIQTAGHTAFSIKDYPALPTPEALFPYAGVGRMSGPMLAIPESLYRDIIGYGQGYRGFPTKVAGQYLRMLYFSAGVATSSAFGDIVPLTWKARLLVTVQALLSLVVFGLFLNALVYTVAANINKQKNSQEGKGCETDMKLAQPGGPPDRQKTAPASR